MRIPLETFDLLFQVLKLEVPGFFVSAELALQLVITADLLVTLLRQSFNRLSVLLGLLPETV